MNYCGRVVTQNKRNWIEALKPKGTKPGYSGSDDIIENGQKVFGLEVAPKTSIIIHSMELGKPYAFPMGRSLTRDDNDAEGRGYGKKRMVACNKLHRGIKSASIRKDADFPVVSHCMNRDKPKNMRKSITPLGEILINTKVLLGCKLELQRQNQKLPPDIKGHGMLERHAVKVARAVLRRGRAGNRSFLFDRLIDYRNLRIVL